MFFLSRIIISATIFRTETIHPTAIFRMLLRAPCTLYHTSLQHTIVGWFSIMHRVDIIGYNDICEQIFFDKNKTKNSPSIKSFLYFCICKLTIRKDAGVVDRDGLENRCTGNCTQGSNPCLSASQLNSKDTQKMRVSFFLW